MATATHAGGDLTGERRIGTGILLAYALPNISISVVYFPLNLYITPFYSEVLGLNLAVVGLALFVTRWTDVITDPLIGTLSDKTKSRIGRRKTWILAGIPLMLFAFWMLMVPPEGVNITVWYLLAFIFLVYLSNTMIDLVYNAWGAELSRDYHERSRVTGFREAFGTFGSVLALSIPLVMASVFGISGLQNMTFALAIATVILLPLLSIPMFLFVPQPEPDRVERTRASVWQDVKSIWRNGPFRRLLIVSLCLLCGLAMTAALSVLFVSHRVGRPDLFPLFVFMYYLSNLVAIPFWVAVGNRIGKHKTLLLVIVSLSFWSAWLPFVPTEWTWVFLALMMLKGACSTGPTLFLLTSMMADVIDVDTLRSGEQRAGLFFSIWGMVKKGAGAFGALIATAGVTLFGFDPRCASTPERLEALQAKAQEGADIAVCQNDPMSLFMLACFYSIFPALIMVAAMPLLRRYPLNEERQQRMRARISKRSSPSVQSADT